MENQERKYSGHIWLGLIMLVIGVALILRQMSLPFPSWLFSWEILLIAIGLFIGIQRNFKGATWIIMLLIGTVFLLEDLIPGISFRHYTWPIILIASGAWLIMSPKGLRRRKTDSESKSYSPEIYSSGDYLDNTCVFGSVRKIILSKDFKGGECVSFMGGTELDLSQADINGRVALEVVQVFGGTKLIIPSHWNLKSDLVSVFGGIEDKRTIQPGSVREDKVLVLEGTSVFGGIEIRNY